MARDASKSVSIFLLTVMCFYVFLGCNSFYKNGFQKSKYRPQGYFQLRLDCGLITFS